MSRRRTTNALATCVLLLGCSMMLGAQRPLDIGQLEGVRRPPLPPLPNDEVRAAILVHARTTPAVSRNISLTGAR